MCLLQLGFCLTRSEILSARARRELVNTGVRLLRTFHSQDSSVLLSRLCFSQPGLPVGVAGSLSPFMSWNGERPWGPH